MSHFTTASDEVACPKPKTSFHELPADHDFHERDLNSPPHTDSAEVPQNQHQSNSDLTTLNYSSQDLVWGLWDVGKLLAVNS